MDEHAAATLRPFRIDVPTPTLPIRGWAVPAGPGGTEFGRGGHFAAPEAPDLFVGDVRAFFRQLR